MRLDLGPLEALAPTRPFSLEGRFEPLEVGGETIEFLAPVVVRGRVERVRGGAMVRGEVVAPVGLRCGRCLDRYRSELRAPLDVVLRAPGLQAGRDDDADSVPYAPQVDLTPAVEEAIVLELPVRPLCRVDCQGLCPRCGTRREGGCECEPEPDERWRVLADRLMDQGGPEGDGRRG
jgi:uncharacterized protein